MNKLDELEINYLKRSFGKWVVNKNDLDSSKIKDLIRVRAHVDGRSRYTIIEEWNCFCIATLVIFIKYVNIYTLKIN